MNDGRRFVFVIFVNALFLRNFVIHGKHDIKGLRVSRLARSSCSRDCLELDVVGLDEAVLVSVLQRVPGSK